MTRVPRDGTNDPLDDRIDAALRRNFAPPATDELAPALRAAILGGTTRSQPMRGRFMRAAAAVILLVCGSWLLVRSFTPDVVNPYDIQPHRSALAVYDALSDEGFEPLWQCRDDAEFAGVFMDRHGQPLVITAMPETHAALGIHYANVISPRSTLVLARVNGNNIMLVIDRVDRDTDPGSLRDGLFAHRAEVGDLVIYELSPLDEASVIPYFVIPEPQPDAAADAEES